jgi:hypothetical protein
VFDTSLRERDAEWGIRDIGDIRSLAAGVGLALVETVEMPANNLILVFARSNAEAGDHPRATPGDHPRVTPGDHPSVTPGA